MKKKSPLISIIMPCYQPGKSVERILNSIKNQTYKNIEIICVDAINRPDKRIKSIVERYGKYLIYGPERSNQRNFGAKNSKGRYLLFIDQDTLLSKNLVKECVETMKRDFMIIIPENSFGQGFWSKIKSFERSMYRGGDVSQGARFFEKKTFLDVNGYDPDLIGTEDLDLFNRLKAKGIKSIEIMNCLYHDEGKLTLKNISRRIIYYSKSFKKYKERHPEIAKKQFTLLRPIYIKNWKKMIKNPVLSFGFIIIKFVEGISAFYGMNIKKSWGDCELPTG